jgi:outer membrane protein
MKKQLLTAIALLPAWSAAVAQEAGDTRVRLGLGAQYRPKFIGSDENRLAPLFGFDIARGTNEFLFKAPDDSFGPAWIARNGFRAGMAGNLSSGRKDSDVGAPLGKVSTTFELGAFAQYEITDSMRVRAELRKGIGGHEGLVGQVGLDKIWRDGDRWRNVDLDTTLVREKSDN